MKHCWACLREAGDPGACGNLGSQYRPLLQDPGESRTHTHTPVRAHPQWKNKISLLLDFLLDRFLAAADGGVAVWLDILSGERRPGEQ